MSLTKDKLKQFVQQGKAYEKLLQSTNNEASNNLSLLNQLKQTKKLLNKVT